MSHARRTMIAAAVAVTCSVTGAYACTQADERAAEAAPPTAGTAQAQTTPVELLLPGNEYHQADVPPNAPPTWWVLHRLAGDPVLEMLPVAVTPVRGCGDEDQGALTGRAVTVPDARDPIVLVRGGQDLAAGPVRTAFVDDAGTGEAPRVETQWGDRTVIVHHVTVEPVGDQPGRYRIELTVGDERRQLHADQWHGDGQWRVRWIGDLNRDGWPDLLLDASYKYSVSTTRLFLSRATDAQVDFPEVARFEHTAC